MTNMIANKVKIQHGNDQINRLTERECEVLRLIAQGATSREIGQQLGISPKTAEAHRNNIKKKLHANTIAHLVQCAIVFGLIEPQCPSQSL
ncbi:MAG: helix-turn-helix transcriptional regulator [Acidobacteriota bacterium]